MKWCGNLAGELSNTINQIYATMSNGQLPPLNYNDITKIARTEQESTQLSEIRKDFYPSLREYLDRMKRESEEEIRRDPYSMKASSMQNEVKKVTQKGNQIFVSRQRKVMLMALRELSGGKGDVSRLTAEEKHFYEDVTDRLKAVKSAAMEGQGYVPMRSSMDDSVCGLVATMEAESVARGNAQGVSAQSGPSSHLNVFVRIVQDIPSLTLGARTYILAKEDVVSLPASIGCELVKSGKAVEIVPVINGMH
jgi:DNA replication initiation complex subunit (GINS family)